MMRFLIIYTVLNLIASGVSFGQKVEALFSYAQFYSPADGPFLETYLAFSGASIEYNKINEEEVQGEVEVMIIISTDDSIVYYDKYDLKSPVSNNDNSIKPNFIDQQRIPLPNGIYSFFLQVVDKNTTSVDSAGKTDPNKALRHDDIIVIDFDADSIVISDFELVESFEKAPTKTHLTKAGYDLIPFASNYYPPEVNELVFYCELYNTKKILGSGEQFLISYYLESYEMDMTISKFKRFSRETASEVNVVLSKFNIESLPSGNYNLTLEVRDRNNNLLASKTKFIQRNKPGEALTYEDFGQLETFNTFVAKFTSIDSLAECIRSLGPISTIHERRYAETQLEMIEFESLRKYFLHFWLQRDNIHPEDTWNKYNTEVKKVQQNYGTIISKGYETERGRVYLQYGQPNSISESKHAPATYPYEIWHYYNISNRGSVMFVFYNRDLVTDQYELLHSNLPGEPYDAAWHYKLQQRDIPLNDIDTQFGTDHYGGRSLDLYNNPR